MLKRNNSRKGVIDPISIIGGLFLVITLIVSAVVVKNRNTSLNINEKAKDDCACGVANGACKSCVTTTVKTVTKPKPADGEVGIENWVNPNPVVTNPVSTQPVNNNLEQAEVQNIQQVITAPVVINGTVVNPATSVPVTEEATGGAPVTNTVVVVPTAAPTTCSAQGAQYPENSVVVYAGQGSYRKCVDGLWVNNCGEADGTIKLCEITDLTPNFVPTYLGGQYQAAIEAQQQLLNPATEAYVAGPAIQTPRPQTNTNNQTTTTNTTASVNNNSSVSTSSTCNPGCPSGQSCVLIGMGYYGCQNTTGTNSITKYADSTCGGTCGTNQECWHSDGGYVCKTVAYVPYTPQQQSNTATTSQQNNQTSIYNPISTTPVVTTSLQDFINSLTNRFNQNSNQNSSYNPCPAGSSYIDHTCVSNGQNITNAENQIAEIKKQKDLEKQTNYPIYNFAECNRDGLTTAQTAECNRKFSQMYNMPLVGSYLQAYAPEKVAYNYLELGYGSLNECLNDPTNMGRGQSKCTGYQPTTEQVSSSVRLGGAITAAGGGLGALGGAALGVLSIPEMVAAGMAASTAYQTTSATATCVDNPGSKECINEAAWAAVSWANIGTSAWASTLSTGTAETVNAVVNVLNIGADVVDISQSCYGENASSFGCTAAWAGTVFDVGQGVGDISRAVNDSLSGLSGDFGSLPDINSNFVPDINRAPSTNQWNTLIIEQDIANIADGNNSLINPNINKVEDIRIVYGGSEYFTDVSGLESSVRAITDDSDFIVTSAMGIHDTNGNPFTTDLLLSPANPVSNVPSPTTPLTTRIENWWYEKGPNWFGGGSPAGDPRADEMTFQIGKSHQTDFFDNELDKAVSRNHGEITYNPDDGSLTYLDKDSKNGTWFREEESGEFIKLKKNEPLIITPNTEISPAKGIPFKVVLDNGSISLVDATAFSKKPAVLYSNNADDGPVIIEDLAIVTRNTEIINKRELMPETDNVVVDGRRPVEGFIDQDGNINIGTPPALSNSTHYPIYISKKVFAAAEGPNYQLVFDESIPPNLQRILKSTENEINNYNPPEIPQPSKSILEKIKDSLDEMFSSIGLGGSPSVNPDANTDIGSVRIDNGRMVTVLSNQNSNPGAKIEIFEFKPGDLVVEDGDAMPIPQSHINSEPVGYIVNNRTTGEKSLPIRLKANNRLIIPDGNQVDITFGQINQIGLFEEFKTNSPTININSDEINISMSTPLTSSLITKMTGTLEFAITGKTPVLPNYPLPSIGNEIKIIDINDSSLNLNPDIVNAIRWVNKQGIAVLSGPDLGKTNPEIFGGEYPAGGRAFPDKKMIAIKDNILQRGDPDAIAKIYHEAAGHIIGEQLPNNTVPNKIINELLAQRAASLMLIQQGVKADPTSFSNITGLVERYLKLTGKDPYQIIDAVIYKAYPDLQKPLK